MFSAFTNMVILYDEVTGKMCSKIIRGKFEFMEEQKNLSTIHIMFIQNCISKLYFHTKSYFKHGVREKLYE